MKLYIGEDIRRLRIECGLTQEMLAEKLGVSFQSVSRWETDQSYPDVEIIPEIAAFFDVTTDEIMGVDKAVMERRISEDWDKVNRMTKPEEKLEMYREMRRKYPRDKNVLHMLIVTLSRFPEHLNEMSGLVEEYLRLPDVEAWNRDTVIAELIMAEQETNVPKLLDRYSTSYPASRSSLLAMRYNRKGDFETEKKYHQHNFLRQNSYLEYVFVRYGGSHRRLLELYNWYTGTQGLSLAAGDGVPDLWYSHRLVSGFRYAEECVIAGRIDEAFACLDDVVTLYESFYSLPVGTVLSFRCDELSELKITLEDGVCMPILFNDETKGRYKCFRAKEADFGVDLMIQREEMKSSDDLYHLYCPQYDMFPLVHKYGWNGFDPVRNDERYVALVERMRKFVVEV